MSDELEHTNPDSKPTFGGLPSFDDYYSDEDGLPINAKHQYATFICEECERLKSDVIGYTLPTMILHPRALRVDYLRKCRSCIRRHVVLRLWLVILLSHIFSPIFVAWWLFVFVQSFYKRPG